jgi:hypothetical protein
VPHYGAFDQVGPHLPAVVGVHHRARRAYLDAMTMTDPSPYREATRALLAEVRARGGRWTVGCLTYSEHRDGLAAEEAPGTVPEETTEQAAARVAAEIEREGGSRGRN